MGAVYRRAMLFVVLNFLVLLLITYVRWFCTMPIAKPH